MSRYGLYSCEKLTEITILSRDIEFEDNWVTKCENLKVIRVQREIYDFVSAMFIDNDAIKIKKINRLFH